MKRAIAWCICLVAVLLPHRACIVYAELVGWAAQAAYKDTMRRFCAEKEEDSARIIQRHLPDSPPASLL